MEVILAHGQVAITEDQKEVAMVTEVILPEEQVQDLQKAHLQVLETPVRDLQEVKHTLLLQEHRNKADLPNTQDQNEAVVHLIHRAVLHPEVDHHLQEEGAHLEDLLADRPEEADNLHTYT